MAINKRNLFHEFELEGWQRAAEQYGPGFGGVTVQAIGPLLDSVGAAQGIRLLDVACGPGYVASSAAKRGCSVVGIDFSSSMIDLARENYPGVEFRVGDAENLDFPDGSFDAVAMNFGMLHLADPDQAIHEAWRVLRPGGQFAFTVWEAPPKTAGFAIVLDAVGLHGNMQVSLPEGPPFFRFSDAAESKRALAEAGFTGVQVATIPQTWRLESGDALFTTMRHAAVRTAALLNRQTPEALRNIQQEISAGAERFRKPAGIELPMPAVLISAVKPSLDVGREPFQSK